MAYMVSGSGIFCTWSDAQGELLGTHVIYLGRAPHVPVPEVFTLTAPFSLISFVFILLDAPFFDLPI